MELKVKRNDLLKSVQDTIAVIPTRSTLPVLSHLLIEAEESLTVTATDLEICIRKRISYQGTKGKITVPARKFQDILRELSSEEIYLEEGKNHAVNIKGTNSNFKLLGFSPEEYPDVALVKGRKILISTNNFKELVSKTSFAVSKEETRYVLNGILMELDKDKVRLVASDGKRLALAEKEVNNEYKARLIIPQKALVELCRIVEGEEIEIVIGEKENQIAFNFENGELITRLIEGEFPRYQDVIPPLKEKRVKLNKEKFLSALRRVSIFTTVDSLATNLEVYKDKLIISKITPELGEAREEIEISYEGEEIVVSFNPYFLIDVLKVIDEEEVEFELNGVDKPAVFRKDSQYIYLILPMQTM